MNEHEGISFRQVLLLLLLLIPVLQLLVPGLRRRLEELAREERAREAEEDAAAEVDVVPLHTAAIPPEAASPARVRRPVRDGPAPARAEEPQLRRRPRMNASDARRAVVAMAVFGPCRGAERPRAG